MVELGFKEKEEFLNYFVPPRDIPIYVRNIADDIERATVLLFKDYGVIITNSINDILKYLKKKGYSMVLAEYFTDIYHSKLLEFHKVDK